MAEDRSRPPGVSKSTRIPTSRCPTVNDAVRRCHSSTMATRGSLPANHASRPRPNEAVASAAPHDNNITSKYPRLGFEIECDGFVELDRSVPNIITDSRPLIYEFLVPQVEQQARVTDAIHESSFSMVRR